MQPGTIALKRSTALPTTAQSEPAATVTVYPDGPLVVRGDFEVRDLDGRATTEGRVVALCRCGRSAVKPLCDGSHKRGPLQQTDD